MQSHYRHCGDIHPGALSEGLDSSLNSILKHRYRHGRQTRRTKHGACLCNPSLVYVNVIIAPRSCSRAPTAGQLPAALAAARTTCRPTRWWPWGRCCGRTPGRWSC